MALPCPCFLNVWLFIFKLSLGFWTALGWRLYIYLTPSFILTESELLQNEVSVVTTGEAVGAESKTPPSLRRRKRTSRRQGDKEKEREVGGAGSGDRADRGVREHRDRREASKSACKELKYFVVVGFCFFFPHFLAMLALSVISCQLILNNYFKFKTIRETAL